MNDRLKALADAGVSIWLDDLSRERLHTGNLVELVRESSVVGVTTNPTIFATAIAKGHEYDDQIRAGGLDSSVEDTLKALTTDDARRLRRARRHNRLRAAWTARSRSSRSPPRHGYPSHYRAGRGPVEDRRPTQHADQDPGHRTGPAGHYGDHRRGHQRERDVDLRSGSLRRSHRRLPRRPRAGRRERTRPEPDPFRRIILRLPVDTEVDKRLDAIGTDQAKP